MPATYLGAVTIGGTVGGLAATFELIGDALEALNIAASAAVSAIATAQAAIDAQVDLIGAAKLAIRIPAIADFQVRIAGADSSIASLNLALTDPGAFLAQLTLGLGQVNANLGLFASLPSINASLAFQLALKLELNAKIGAVDLQLDALVTIQAAIEAQVAALASLSAALAAAITATVGAINAFASMSLSLGTAGAKLFLYTGTLAGLGAAIDAVSAASGISGAANVRVPLVVVEQSNGAAVAALNAVFTTS